jgi:hypothetical protein
MASYRYSSWPGVLERRIHVEGPYSFVQETVQAFDPALAAQNRALGEAQDPRGSVRLLARGVPVAVYEQSVREEWDEARWTRWLEDPDNAAFRVSRERL